MTHMILFLQAAPSSPASFLSGVLPIVLMVGIFYFLVYMPMRKQQKNQKNMIATLENGQTVQTSGGIVGTIIAVNDDTLILRVKPDNLKLQVARSAVTRVVGAEEASKK